MELIIRDKRQAFAAIYQPSSMGDGEPAYGNKLIIEPTDAETIAMLDDAMLKVAVDKWKAEGKQVLDYLIGQKRVCFVKAPYCNSKTGVPYDGFEGMYYLSTRSPKLKPTVKNKFNADVTEGQPGAPYSGCYVHSAVDIWAQDNQYGRRINCTLQGIMFSRDGGAFTGGRPADDNTFASLAAAPEAADFV